VHLVPHTHDDTGWQVTVDQYFFDNVYYVLDTVVPRLADNPDRHFIYVEIGFFARWWDQQPERVKNMTRRVVKNGQLEFINGGWCMHDEASPYYVAMVDQTTRGHMFLKKNFGIDAIPRGTWQIDPFGHSNTNAYLIGAEAGMQSLFWGRTDYQDLNYRKLARNHTDDHWPEWIWQGSASLGKGAQVFAGELGGGGYGAPISFNSASYDKMAEVQDDPRRHDYNVDAWVDRIIEAATSQATFTKTTHQLWACGSDFEYQNADRWYHNLDKLIHYLNLNGTINLLYSTPTKYVKAKYAETIKRNMSWEVRTDDIFPLADNSHNYWSGYFTSRAALKKQVRFATNFLQAARQLEVIAKPGAIGVVTARPSPVVGNSFTDSLEGTIGVATHHDGMSGTERQDVSDDYEQRISESHIEAEVGVARSLEKLLGGSDVVLEHCNCNGKVGAVGGDCLNISVCVHTTGRDKFDVIAWNVQAHTYTDVFRVPVSGGGKYSVTQLGNTAEPTKPIQLTVQAIPLTMRDYELPLLYLRYHELENSTLVSETRNKATHVLVFEGSVPPVGYATFQVKKEEEGAVSSKTKVSVPEPSVPSGIKTYSLGSYSITVDHGTGRVTRIHNVESNVSVPFTIDWGWYNSSVGGCTQGVSKGVPECSGQKSGAYIFRPNSSHVFTCGPDVAPSVEVVDGELVIEIRQTFSDWATHVIRLIKGRPWIEVEYTVGPIPINQPWLVAEQDEAALCGKGGCKWGKEVIMKYKSGLDSGREFYTDSNGREMLLRKRDARGPSYPAFNISEPVAGNYYPTNAIIALHDEKSDVQLAIVTDVSQGGSSMASGELELMVQRRVQQDDSRGVQEPLNETMCGCNDEGATPGTMGEHGQEGDGGCDCAGLTMRGRHLIVLDKKTRANEIRRVANEHLQNPPTLAINVGTGTPEHTSFSAIKDALPANIKLMTLTSNYDSIFEKKVMLRLAHLYSVDEHPTLSKAQEVALSEIFAKAGLKVTEVEEMSLSASMPLAQMEAEKLKWPQHATTGMWHTSENAVSERTLLRADDPTFTVTLRPMEIRTLIVSLE